MQMTFNKIMYAQKKSLLMMVSVDTESIYTAGLANPTQKMLMIVKCYVTVRKTVLHTPLIETLLITTVSDIKADHTPMEIVGPLLLVT